MPKTLFTKYPVMKDYDVLFLGAPGPSDDVYALYEPIYNTFLAVGSDLPTIQHLSFLFSSRYVLYVCRINVARNYVPNIMDNLSCGNWSISNRDTFTITRFPDLHRIIDVDQLVSHRYSGEWDFTDDREYIKLAYRYLTEVLPDLKSRFDSEGHGMFRREYSDSAKRLRDSVERLPGMPSLNIYQNAIDQILHTIYLEFDLDKAKNILTSIRTNING